MAETNESTSSLSIKDVEDLIHSFLIIMLDHSLLKKDGWKNGFQWYTDRAQERNGPDMRNHYPSLTEGFLSELLDFGARELRVQDPNALMEFPLLQSLEANKSQPSAGQPSFHASTLGKFVPRRSS